MQQVRQGSIFSELLMCVGGVCSILLLEQKFIVFRSPQLKCNLSGLSVNVGVNMITQPSTMRDLGVIFDKFLSFVNRITAICRNTYFQIRNMDKIWILLSYDAYLLLFMHLLIVD